MGLFFTSKKEKFLNLMSIMGLNNFALVEDKIIENGHLLKIKIPPTGTVKNLEDKQEQLETYFKAVIEINKDKFTDIAEVKVYTKDIGNFRYEPVAPAKYTDLYLGKTFDNKPYFLDIRTNPHIIAAGITGSGKSYLLATMLTNLIYFYSNKYELYLCQTSKRDIDYIKDCKIVKSCVYTPTDTYIVLTKAIEEINNRCKLFASVGCKGIDHYNKCTRSNIKRRIYVFEEIALYMPDDTDTDAEKKAKKRVWGSIQNIVKLGREAGIHFLAITQRTTTTNLGGNGDIKSQLARITFKQPQAVDSSNVIGCDLATKLSKREFYILSTEGLHLVKAPTIDKEMKLLHKYIPEIKVFEPNLNIKNDAVRENYIDMRIEDYNKLGN